MIYNSILLTAPDVEGLHKALIDLFQQKKYVQNNENAPDIVMPVVGKIINIQQFTKQVIRPGIDPRNPRIENVLQLLIITKEQPVLINYEKEK